jgi:hypothetical protein
MWYLKRWAIAQVLLMDNSKLINKIVIKGKAPYSSNQLWPAHRKKKKKFRKIYSFYMLRNFKLEKRAKATLGIHKKHFLDVV